MKKLIIALVLTTGIATISFAQASKKAPAERAKNQTQWMQTNLSLTPDQNQKAYSINLAHAQTVDKIYAAGGDKEKLKEAQMKKVNDLKTILKPVQFKKFQDHEASANQKR